MEAQNEHTWYISQLEAVMLFAADRDHQEYLKRRTRDSYLTASLATGYTFRQAVEGWRMIANRATVNIISKEIDNLGHAGDRTSIS